MVKIAILNENAAGKTGVAAHGLSYLIFKDAHTLLFDTGPSDVFIRNAEAMGLDVDQAEAIVLSHGHWDHTNGLALKFRGQKLEGKRLVAHPDAFIRRYRKSNGEHHGAPLTEAEASTHFQLELSQLQVEVLPGIFFLGEIPRETSFEPTRVLATREDGSPDELSDDTALALVDAGRLHVITGCSHAGIVNIVQHARRVTGIHQVQTVMGGFHLQANNAQTQATIAALRQMKIPNIRPSHCTELPALAAFYQAFGFRQVKTGEVISL